MKIDENPQPIDSVTQTNINQSVQNAGKPSQAFDSTPYQMEIADRLKSRYSNELSRLQFDRKEQENKSQFQSIQTALGLKNAEVSYNMQRAEIIRKRKMAEDAQRAQLIGTILGVAGAAVGTYVGGPAGGMAGYQVGQGVGAAATQKGSMFESNGG